MGENVVFLVIFDTCDVMYNWSISLLPTIVLDNIFAMYYCCVSFINLHRGSLKILLTKKYRSFKLDKLTQQENVRGPKGPTSRFESLTECIYHILIYIWSLPVITHNKSDFRNNCTKIIQK